MLNRATHVNASGRRVDAAKYYEATNLRNVHEQILSED